MSLVFNEPLIIGKKEAYNPDVFTKVGNPVITNEGVASGFSTSNFLYSMLTFTPTESLIYKCKFKTGSNITDNQYVIRFYNDLTGEWVTNAVGVINGNIRCIFKDYVIYTYSCEINTDYFVELEFLTTASKARIYDSEHSLLQEFEYSEAPVLMKGNNSRLTIGILQSSTNSYASPWLGSIDLKELKVEVDGVEILSGTKMKSVKEWQTKPFKFDVNSIN